MKKVNKKLSLSNILSIPLALETNTKKDQTECQPNWGTTKQQPKTPETKTTLQKLNKAIAPEVRATVSPNRKLLDRLPACHYCSGAFTSFNFGGGNTTNLKTLQVMAQVDVQIPRVFSNFNS